VPTIFISYRREDTSGYAGRLYDRLRQEFGHDNVFLDLELKPGEDFVDAILARLTGSDLMLVLIGRRWLNAADEKGGQRLGDEGDFVRIEIQTALERKLRTIPVLVDRATLPRLQDLPEPLRPLGRIQAIELSDTRWDYDVGLLVQSLRRAEGERATAANPAARDDSARMTMAAWLRLREQHRGSLPREAAQPPRTENGQRKAQGTSRKPRRKA
jgi:hypothetical protein